jgi:hypothetical protein
MSIDLSDPTQWNFVFRRNLTAGATRIPTQTFTTTAKQVFIGISVPDQPNWYRGGFLTQYLPALPSSTNNLFTALTQVLNVRLTCRNYQIVELVDAKPDTSVCTIVLPAYFESCQLEVYARNDV